MTTNGQNFYPVRENLDRVDVSIVHVYQVKHLKELPFQREILMRTEIPRIDKYIPLKILFLMRESHSVRRKPYLQTLLYQPCHGHHWLLSTKNRKTVKKHFKLQLNETCRYLNLECDRMLGKFRRDKNSIGTNLTEQSSLF